MRRTLTVIFAAIALVVTCGAGWPTDHGDNRRSGSATTAAKFRSFSPGFTRTLDGAVYGSPILAGGNVIVATENNTVYALDPANGAEKWQRHLRTPISDSSQLACPGNIRPTGITGSPVFDAVTGRIFVVTITHSPTLGVTHELWGISPSNGSVSLDKRVEVPGTDPKAQQQRAALAVDRGNVYIGFGGLVGDCGNYKGAMLAIKASGAAGGRAYVVPTPREGAIWASGGPVVEPNGNLLFAVGNGQSTSSYDYSDSVTEVNPAMVRTGFFAPTSWAADNASDLDLGSMTPALTSAGYVLQVGKSGTAYTARLGHLGGIGGQVATGYVCQAYGVSAGGGSTVFLPCTDGVKRVDVRSNGTWTVNWTAAGIPGSPITGPGAVYSIGGTRLFAINGATGRTISSIEVGTTSRFATPMLVGRKAYVGTRAGITAVNVG